MDRAPLLRRELLLLCLVVAALALAARWAWAPGWEGPSFRPRPDALEYAAAAQAVAGGSGYVLRVGPEAVRPRYAPGWPLVLAPAVAAGLDGRSLWRVTGLFGALQAALLGALAWLGVIGFAPAAGRAGSSVRLRVAAAAAGLAAGCAWAFAPMMVKAGRTLLSDEPAAFAATAALAVTGRGLLARGRPARRALLACAAGGLAAGAAAALRPPSGAILALPLALMAVGAGRLRGWKVTARRCLPWLAAAAFLPAASSAVLLASGQPPWPWTAYDLWIPGRYASLSDTFGLRFALEGDPHLSSVLPGLRGSSNLELAARTLLGLPARLPHQTAGLLWPAAGWVAALGLGVAALRRGERGARGEPRAGGWMAAAVAAWVLGHGVLYALYFFPAPRFYVPALAVAAVALAVGGGALLARPGRASRLAGSVVLLLFAGSLAHGFGALRREPHPRIPTTDTRSAFVRWIDLSDAERASRTVPFDPVEAQALGLLDPATAERIGAWGELPPTIQVRRLRARGLLPGR